LQLKPPWRVVSSDLDFDRRRVDLRLGFRAGSRFPCPQCGRACQAVEFTEGTWRQPDMIGFEAFVTARLPSISCPEQGDVALTPSWASDNVSVTEQQPDLHRPLVSSVTAIVLQRPAELTVHAAVKPVLVTLARAVARTVLARWRLRQRRAPFLVFRSASL
jgi:transposase